MLRHTPGAGMIRLGDDGTAAATDRHQACAIPRPGSRETAKYAGSEIFKKKASLTSKPPKSNLDVAFAPSPFFNNLAAFVVSSSSKATRFLSSSMDSARR